MPAFAMVRYSLHVIMIALLSAFMTFVIHDSIVAPTFNALVGAHLVADIGYGSMMSLHYGIGAFALLALVFASVGEILVANARSDMNSPLIVSSPIGTFVCAMFLIAGIMMNWGVTITLDTLMITTSTPFIGFMMGTPFEPIISAINGMFSVAHLFCVFVAVLGFLYMIVSSVQRESLSWLIGG